MSVSNDGPAEAPLRVETRLAVLGRGAAVLEINVDGEDADARRFYERHGYANTEPGQDETMLYYFRELR